MIVLTTLVSNLECPVQVTHTGSLVHVLMRLYYRNLHALMCGLACVFSTECSCKNGTCQDGLLGDGSCRCAPGWMGDSCDKSK